MTLRRPIGFGTKAIHGRKHQDKHEPDNKNPYRTLSTPIFMSSTFAFENTDHGAAIFSGKSSDYTYTRIANPTTAALENEIAYLEGGEKGLAFASGMAAISHFTFGLAKPGDKFVFTKTIYGGSYKFFAHTCREIFQLNAVAVDGTNLDEVAAAVDDQTKFLFIETPANPTIAMVDIAGCAAIAKKHGVPLAVDNTFATPYLQNPIALGADYSVHSATKYLSGHGDTVGGLLVGPTAMMTQIHKQIATMVGGCISPFNSWLILRGIRSLPVRMDRHCENAMEIAQFLSFHPKVARVYYPGLRTDPYHELAKRQMRGFGGMVAFDVKGGREAAKTVCDNVHLWTLAVSLGDVDSLIVNPATTTHSAYTDAEMREAGFDPGMIRLSVGLEDVEDLIQDLRDALKLV